MQTIENKNQKMTNYLSCHVLKVAHHGSMHSSPLDVYEKMSPNLAVISSKQEQSTSGGRTRDIFPHQSATIGKYHYRHSSQGKAPMEEAMG